MVLYGQTPNDLARQQFGYDQMYGDANRVNADAITQAQMAQVKMALDQQKYAHDDAQNQLTRDWDANQKALDRASATQNTQIQYQGAEKDRQIVASEKDYQLAQTDAQRGAIPADLTAIKKAYPQFSDPQIKSLFQLAGKSAANQAMNSAQAIAQHGQAPDESLLKSHGVPTGTKFEDQVKSFIATMRQPYEQAYANESEQANVGNIADRIQALQTSPASNQPGAWSSPQRLGGSILNWAAGLDGSLLTPEPIQPTPQAANRLQALVQKSNTATQGENPTLTGTAGNYMPKAPANWRPAFAPQPQAAPAPVSPVAAAPAPPAPPASQRKPGQRYATPKGVLTWTGTGWTI